MKRAGQVVLFRISRTDLEQGKLRPALLLAQAPGEFNDWLICMISSQTRHAVADFDEIVHEEDADFAQTGLKQASVLRIARLALVEGELLLGAVGAVAPDRLRRIQSRLADWIVSSL